MKEKKGKEKRLLVFGHYVGYWGKHDIIGACEEEEGGGEHLEILALNVDGPLHFNNSEGGRPHQTFIDRIIIDGDKGKYSYGSGFVFDLTCSRKAMPDGTTKLTAEDKGNQREFKLTIVDSSKINKHSKVVLPILLKLLPKVLELKDFDVVPREGMDTLRALAGAAAEYVGGKNKAKIIF